MALSFLVGLLVCLSDIYLYICIYIVCVCVWMVGGAEVDELWGGQGD
jgi:hypothetical protein